MTPEYFAVCLGFAAAVIINACLLTMIKSLQAELSEQKKATEYTERTIAELLIRQKQMVDSFRRIRVAIMEPPSK